MLMTQWFRSVAAVLSAGFIATASAQDIKLEPSTFEIPDFGLASGQTLPRMVVEYATLGTPERDAEGRIVNAVVNPHGWSGNYAQTIGLAKGLLAPGMPLDPARWYVIFPTALGSPGSSAPSTSGLGPDFPKYTLADMITAQYRLVTEHLGIEKLAGVVGISMGGYQTLQWITQYPDMMSWAIPIAASVKADGRNLGIFGVMSDTIRQDPAYQDGRYTEQPKASMRRAFMGTYLWYFGDAFYDARYKTEADALKGLADAGLGSDKMDANDIVWRNDAMATYDVRPGLAGVKAKVLAVGAAEDELFPAELAIKPIADGIAGARHVIFSSPLGHVGTAVHIDRAADEIKAFMAEAAPR